MKKMPWKKTFGLKAKNPQLLAVFHSGLEITPFFQPALHVRLLCLWNVNAVVRILL